MIGGRVELFVRAVVSTTVAIIGAAAGFAHTHTAALQAGQTGWLAWADAVVIELMVVIAGLHVARDLRNGHRPIVSIAVVIAAFLIQMGSQVATAPANFAGWLFAAVPALACLVIVKVELRAATSRRSDVTTSEVVAVGPAQSVHADVVWTELPQERPAELPAPAKAAVASPVPAVWPPQ